MHLCRIFYTYNVSLQSELSAQNCRKWHFRALYFSKFGGGRIPRTLLQCSSDGAFGARTFSPPPQLSIRSYASVVANKHKQLNS